MVSGRLDGKPARCRQRRPGKSSGQTANHPLQTMKRHDNTARAERARLYRRGLRIEKLEERCTVGCLLPWLPGAMLWCPWVPGLPLSPLSQFDMPSRGSSAKRTPEGRSALLTPLLAECPTTAQQRQLSPQLVSSDSYYAWLLDRSRGLPPTSSGENVTFDSGLNGWGPSRFSFAQNGSAPLASYAGASALHFDVAGGAGPVANSITQTDRRPTLPRIDTKGEPALPSPAQNALAQNAPVNTASTGSSPAQISPAGTTPAGTAPAQNAAAAVPPACSPTAAAVPAPAKRSPRPLLRPP